MIHLNTKQNNQKRVYFITETKKRVSNSGSRTVVDFFTYRSVPSISWMQEGFKAELR